MQVRKIIMQWREDTFHSWLKLTQAVQLGACVLYTILWLHVIRHVKLSAVLIYRVWSCRQVIRFANEAALASRCKSSQSSHHRPTRTHAVTPNAWYTCMAGWKISAWYLYQLEDSTVTSWVWEPVRAQTLAMWRSNHKDRVLILQANHQFRL